VQFFVVVIVTLATLFVNAILRFIPKIDGSPRFFQTESFITGKLQECVDMQTAWNLPVGNSNVGQNAPDSNGRFESGSSRTLGGLEGDSKRLNEVKK
jgi:hypothetical protein